MLTWKPTLKEKVKQKLKEKETSLNEQPVQIRNLLVYADEQKYSYGESREHTNSQKSSTMERLVSEIEILANVANSYHEEFNCEKRNKDENIYTIKKGMENNITRILTPEFFLYPAKPLTITEYNELLRIIETIGNKQQPNVHLMLSSVAVETPDKQLINVTLYVECGKPSKITTVCKRRAAAGDQFYDNLAPALDPEASAQMLYHMPLIKDELQIEDIDKIPKRGETFVLTMDKIFYIGKNKQSIIPISLGNNPDIIKRIHFALENRTGMSALIPDKTILAMDDTIKELNKLISPLNKDAATFFAQTNNFVLSNHGLFTVTTSGGASYYQGIEICAEHGSQHLHKLLDFVLNEDNSSLIPKKVDHILTSNSTDLNPNAAISRFDCELLLMEFPPVAESLHLLPITSKAYVRNADKLYYVDKIQNTIMLLNTPSDTLKYIDQSIGTNNLSKDNPSKKLSIKELYVIGFHTKHYQHAVTYIDSENKEQFALHDNLSKTDLFPIDSATKGSDINKKNDGSWAVTNPPFGSSFTIVPIAPRLVETFSDNFKVKVAMHNQKVMDKQVENLLDTKKVDVPAEIQKGNTQLENTSHIASVLHSANRSLLQPAEKNLKPSKPNRKVLPPLPNPSIATNAAPAKEKIIGEQTTKRDGIIRASDYGSKAITSDRKANKPDIKDDDDNDTKGRGLRK